jgi:histidine triad (HIT) family protein
LVILAYNEYMTDNCLFCKITSGEIPATKVYEDNDVFAFLDINPINKGHVLVIPKKHYETLLDMDDQILQKRSLIIRDLAVAIKKGTGSDGINTITNNGEIAGQEVFHAHTHIIPRFLHDGHKMWESKTTYKENEMGIVAESIKKEL